MFHAYSGTVVYTRHDGSTGSVGFGELTEDNLRAQAQHNIDYYTLDDQTRYPEAHTESLCVLCESCKGSGATYVKRGKARIYKPGSCKVCKGSGVARTLPI